MSKKRNIIFVCRGGSCDDSSFGKKKAAGGQLVDALEELLKQSGCEGVGIKETGCRDLCNKGRIVALKVGSRKIHFGKVNGPAIAASLVNAAGAVARGEDLPEDALLDKHALDKLKRRKKKDDSVEE